MRVHRDLRPSPAHRATACACPSTCAMFGCVELSPHTPPLAPSYKHPGRPRFSPARTRALVPATPSNMILPPTPQAKARAHLHYYVGDWPETDCIAVRESAALGCLPLTSTAGALGDKDYTVQVGGDPRQPDVQRRAARRAVELLAGCGGRPRGQGVITPRLMEETWDRVAQQWMEIIGEGGGGTVG